MKIENVSRRQFLQGAFSAGALVLGAQMLPKAVRGAVAGKASVISDDPVAGLAFHPTVFVGIEPDGTVVIVAHRSEMGTGSRTALPRIAADEMDADWTRVRIVQALGDAKYGSQDTDGSHSVRDFFDVMRQSGATAREMLIQAAAQQWKVPANECDAAVHEVVHKASGRKLGYGELAAAASQLPVPAKETLKFKPRNDWRYIGKDSGNYDLQDLCTGKAQYGMDAHVDGMVYAAIAHPPVLGGKVKSYDDKHALAVSGVKQTIQIDPFKPPHGFQPLGGVAVIADNTWAAFQGRNKLNIAWDNGPNDGYDSAQYKKELLETARKACKVVRNVGDVDGEFAKGGKTIEADYYVPHLAHASMEPPVALADFRDGKVFAWAPTQNPQGVQDNIAHALGISKDNVFCNVTLLGGGFGRKSKPDFVVEAAVLSKKTGKPVKVVWSREDDIQFDYYHAVAGMYLKAAVDDHGMPTAWLQRSVFPPIGSTFAPAGSPPATYGGAGEMNMGWSDVPFAIANMRAENGPANAHVRIGWLRSVANIYHAFAVSSFADELAAAAGRDSLEYLLELAGPDRILDRNSLPKDYPNMGGSYDTYPIDVARYKRVAQVAAEGAGWGKRKLEKGEGLGIAVHRSFLTYVATVVRVSVDQDNRLHILRVDTAVDAGTLVNPDNVRNQFEGAAIFGTSLACFGEITATNGVVNQSNFHDYRMCRMKHSPAEIKVHLVGTEAPPAGVGEPGVPPFAPALCNAIFAATGKRYRELPLSRAGLILEEGGR